MSATFGMNKLTFEDFGERTTVPNNNIAKLMYYLDCVLTVIEYDRIILTDYKNYFVLTAEERKLVIELAKLFNPKIFIDARIFIVNPDLLPDDLGNNFLKVTDETIGVHVNEQIMIGGKTVRVLKVMVCNSSWLFKNYYNPLKAIENEIVPGQSISPAVTETSSISTKEVIIVNQSIKYRATPVDLICSYCKCPVKTVTKTKINCLACCCFLFFSIFYICIQALNDKNICCCDVIHKCPRCGRVLGEYTSC